jgi:hypothetical protein
MILDQNGVRYGANPAKPEKLAKVLKLENYATQEFTEFVPPGFDWMMCVPDSVDLNNSLGDCVVAAMAKMERSWTANLSLGRSIATVTDADILSVYEKGAGYNPADPSTDQGWDLLSALSYWQRTGIAGRKIGAYAAINPKHHYMVRAAIYLFGGIYTAFDLPNSIWDQMYPKLWDVLANDGGFAGGHCVTFQGVSKAGNPICRTWGEPQEMTWAFFDKYCTEVYCIQSPDYIANNMTIAGVDLATWTADMTALKAA